MLLERQEQIKLAAANQQIKEGQEALVKLQYQAATADVSGQFSLAIVDLAERAALSTAFALEGMREKQKEQEGLYHECVFQRKQSERLLKRTEEREERENRRREQKTLDDWTTANWRRR
jgi:hypothetical protein